MYLTGTYGIVDEAVTVLSIVQCSLMSAPSFSVDTVSIRRATVADAKAIHDLITSLEHTFSVPVADESEREPYRTSISTSSIAERIRGDDFVYHVAESDGTLVGTVAIREQTHLFHLFVAASMQGGGLGARLWHHARSESPHDGPFTVNASHNAIGFYKRQGFVPDGAPVREKGIAYLPMREGEGDGGEAFGVDS